MCVSYVTIKKASATRWSLLMIWATILIQLVYSNIKLQVTTNQANKQQLDLGTSNFGTQQQLLHHQELDRTTKGQQYLQDSLSALSSRSLFNFGGLIQFAEAGKKKKKEKSEVVVISVNNPGGGKGHGMYPIFIPTCSGGHHGRRRR